MITLEMTTALMLYFGLFLFLCFGAWLISHMKERKKTTLPPLFKLKTCEYCMYHYLAETGKQISTCPQCSSYNKSSPNSGY